MLHFLRNHSTTLKKQFHLKKNFPSYKDGGLKNQWLMSGTLSHHVDLFQSVQNIHSCISKETEDCFLLLSQNFTRSEVCATFKAWNKKLIPLIMFWTLLLSDWEQQIESLDLFYRKFILVVFIMIFWAEGALTWSAASTGPGVRSGPRVSAPPAPKSQNTEKSSN